MRRFALIALLALAPSIALAELATVAPTAPAGDSSDRVANTAWVTNFLSTLPLASGKIWIGSAGNVATPQTPSGDCVFSLLGVVTCTKTNGVAFAPSATTDTTTQANVAFTGLTAAAATADADTFPTNQGAGNLKQTFAAVKTWIKSWIAKADVGLGSVPNVDMTNLSNATSGTLAAARGGAGTINGALKGNGSGVVSQAACADLSNATAWCSASASSWGTYTPTLSCGAGTFTSAVAAGRSLTVGKTTFINVVITITTNGTCSSFTVFTLPNNSAATMFIAGRNNTTGAIVAGSTIAGSATLSLTTSSGTYSGGDGQVIVLNGVYENQ